MCTLTVIPKRIKTKLMYSLHLSLNTGLVMELKFQEEKKSLKEKLRSELCK